ARSVSLPDAAATRGALVGGGDAPRAEWSRAPGTTKATAGQRGDSAVDTDDNSVDFVVDTPTPQSSGTEAPTDPVEPVDPVTVSIADIQGTGDTTPLAGQTVITEGVVTAVFAEGGFNGFYMQTPGTGELKSAGDASDGIFVYVGTSGTYPEIGESVTVTGTPAEYYGMTQLGSATFTEAPAPFEAVTPVAGPESRGSPGCPPTPFRLPGASRSLARHAPAADR